MNVGSFRPGFPLLFVSVVLSAVDPVDEWADTLLRSPEFSHVALSPDGSHLGMQIYINDQRSLGTYDLEKKVGRQIQLESGQDIVRYGWLDGDHLIYQMSELEYYHAGLHYSG